MDLYVVTCSEVGKLEIWDKKPAIDDNPNLPLKTITQEDMVDGMVADEFQIIVASRFGTTNVCLNAKKFFGAD